MINSNKITLPLLLVLALLLSACSSNNIYRSNFSRCEVPPQSSCEPHSIQRHNAATNQEYLLGFVEIDDQSQLRDRAQLQALLDDLYKTASAAAGGYQQRQKYPRATRKESSGNRDRVATS